MKQTEEKKQEQTRTALLVRTMSNGYSVDLEREGYMFYTLQDLMEGLFVHVGMNRLGVMTKEEIKEMVKATKNGCIVKKLQAEVNELKDIIAEQKKEIRKLRIDN